MNVKLPDPLVAADEARPGDLIGWWRDGRPIRLVGGGAEDTDDELDTGEPDDGEDDDQEDGDQEDGDDLEALKDRLRRMEAALRKANKEAERYRRRAKGRQAAPAADADADDAAESAAEVKMKRIAAVAALAGEGLSKPQAKLAARMLDLSSVELDEDGDADFDDAIAELRDTFPALFGVDAADEPPARRRHAAKLTTADKGRSAGRRKLSATDRAVKALVG